MVPGLLHMHITSYSKLLVIALIERAKFILLPCDKIHPSSQPGLLHMHITSYSKLLVIALIERAKFILLPCVKIHPSSQPAADPLPFNSDVKSKGSAVS